VRGISGLTWATQTAIAEFIGGAHLNQGHIQPDTMAGEKFGNLGQIGGNIINFSFKCGLAHTGADKKQLKRKSSLKRFIGDVSGKS
jgi:hypothetical protein